MKKMIMVVDDDTQVRETIAEYLRFFEYEVLEADNGEEALKIFDDNRIDFIISDIRMPIMNGIQLLKTIRTLAPNLPIVLMTGYHPTQAQERAMPSKPDGFLIKPFPLQRLKELIEAKLQP